MVITGILIQCVCNILNEPTTIQMGPIGKAIYNSIQQVKLYIKLRKHEDS